MPAASAAAPSQSIECSRLGASCGIATAIAQNAITPSGRLTMNIQRQLALSAIRPPSGGPAIAAAAKVAPISPW